MNFFTEFSVPLTTFLLLLFNVPVVKSQTVTFSIASSAKIGDSAQFLCNASTQATQYNANFNRHGQTALATAYTPNAAKTNGPGVSVTGSGNQFYYKYTISSLSCSNRGNYSCEVATDKGAFNSQSVEFDVLGPAGTPSLTAPSDNQIFNVNITIFCTSNVGSPAQELSLCVDNICAEQNPPVKLPDQCIFTRNANLTFQVTKTTKKATCRVGSSSLEVTKSWDVDYPVDSIMLIPNLREMKLIRGTTQTFDCVALSNPEPTIMWEFFPQTSQSSTITWGKTVTLDSFTSGVYVCTANNTVGGISYNITVTLTVTVYDLPTKPPPPSTTKGPATAKPGSTTKKIGATAAPSTDKNKIIIGSVIPILIIIIIVIIVIILYKRRAKPAEIEEPPEKPRNNHSEVNIMHTKPDLVHSTGIEKVPVYNNGFDHGGEDDLSSMKATFDDKPRSRKPVIPIASSDGYNTTLPCV